MHYKLRTQEEYLLFIVFYLNNIFTIWNNNIKKFSSLLFNIEKTSIFNLMRCQGVSIELLRAFPRADETVAGVGGGWYKFPRPGDPEGGLRPG